MNNFVNNTVSNSAKNMDNLWETVNRKRKARRSGSTSPSVPSPLSKKPNIAQRYSFNRGAHTFDEESDADETIDFENQTGALSKIANCLNTLSKDVGHIRTSQEHITRRLQTIEDTVEKCTVAVTLVNDDLAETKRDNGKLKERVNELDKIIVGMNSMMEKREDMSRRNNMMIYGMAETDRETWEITEKIVRDMLENKVEIPDATSNATVQIERAQRVGPRHAGKTRPILVFFLQERQRHAVLEKAREKLKGTDIRVGEDFSKRIRDIRHKLYPMMKKARDEGKQASLRYDKLYIDNTVYALKADGAIERVGRR